MKNQAEIGIFGGSGLYEFFHNGKWKKVRTSYGKPSDKVFITEYKGKKIAFIPRHGRGHKLPPHKINYRANLYAFKKLGVKTIIAPTAVGSLKPEIKRGDFVICDQYIDRTRHRKDTFFDKRTVHISAAEPYCPELRKIAIEACQKNNVSVHKNGTVVVIEGPSFSSRSESNWFNKMGWDVVNMTQYPEVILARELEMCYVNISLVTDYDAGLEKEKDIKPVTTDEVIRMFNQNIESVKKVILDMIEMIPKKLNCNCNNALEEAAI